MHRARVIILIAATLAAGCAGRRTPPATRPASELASTRPAKTPDRLALSEIAPVLSLADPAPTTRPAQAPLDALQIYARARAAQLGGDRNAAVLLLRQALDKDPDSYELNYALGLAQVGIPAGRESGIACLQRATQLRPDSFEAHFHLGRQYLAQSELDKAVTELRLALLTTEYRENTDLSTLANLFLARALQQKGYDTAALEQYEVLLHRLEGRLNVRGHPELYFFLARADGVYAQAGELYEKLGQSERALECYRQAAARDPSSFHHQARIVNLLLKRGDADGARTLASDLVSRFRASPDSIDLLRQVFRQSNRESALIEELRRISRERPNDPSLVLALADALLGINRADEAGKLLEGALAQSGGDPIVVGRLFDLYLDRDEPLKAARLVIEASAARPDDFEAHERLWNRLSLGVTRVRLRVPGLERLEFTASAQASRNYWLSRLARVSGRGALGRTALEEAVAAKPPFPPAYRDMLEQTLRRKELSQSEQTARINELIASAERQGSVALAHELRGLWLLSQKKHDDAAAALAKSIDAGAKSPHVRYARAVALFAGNRVSEAENLLWQTVRQWPSYGPAYEALYALYSRSVPHGAERVVQSWVAADPLSTPARILQARFMATHGRRSEAESALLRLFRDDPENPAVMVALRSFYEDRPDSYLAVLEEEHVRHPGNVTLTEFIVEGHLNQRQTDKAVRAVDRLRAAVAKDPDQLYTVAHLYQRLDQAQASEDVLVQILRLDPRHAPANNDLGYLWADEGKDLDRAEAMLRQAVATEPDNGAYQDSLGWALYKRGRFEESRQRLSDAVRLLEQPDAVVLDHLGDVLYRLGQSTEAAGRWNEALQRLGDAEPSRDDLKKLKLQLKEKIERHKAGQPVEVAPVAGSAAQAKH